ncbi:MAG: inositol-3-phosphate synthase [Candidatus Methanofastidiosia archaeon]
MKVKVGIAGVGNCASSLIQGLFYYEEFPDNEVIGLMHHNLGGYKPEDIEIVCAFDVDERKVGKDLSKAIFSPPNCTKKIHDVPYIGVEVKMGRILDGIAPHMREYSPKKTFSPANQDPCDVISELKESGAEILINYMPVGSERATRFYAKACLDAGVAFINCMPVFIASDSRWAEKFEEKKLPLIGDDIKSQIGATIVHRTLTKLFVDRGVKLDRTYQLNTGGNTDFLNMLARNRLKSKKISKTEAVQSQLPKPLPENNIHIGPSDYVPWQKDNKICFLRMEGRMFGDVPMSLELRLSVEDSPNSAGSAIDAVRCCKLALDRGIGGALTSISAYTMKHPPIQYPDNDARHYVEEFIEGKRER